MNLYFSQEINENEILPLLHAFDPHIFIEKDFKKADARVLIEADKIVFWPPMEGKAVVVLILENTIFEKRLLAIKRALYEGLSRCFSKTLPWGILMGIRPGKIVWQLKQQHRTQDEIFRFLTELLFIQPSKAALLIEVVFREQKILAKAQGISIYVHVPFCPSKCSFCSFYSHSLAQKKYDLDFYTDLLCREIAGLDEGFQMAPVDHLYIGGGTPSCLNDRQWTKIFQGIFRSAHVTEDTEITFELGRPDTVQEDLLSCLKHFGVNRLSLNTQSIHEATLKAIGRNHSFNAFVSAYDKIRQYSFPIVNSDLIYGLPFEDESLFYESVKVISHMDFENITIHGLALKRGSRLKNEGYQMKSASQFDLQPIYAHLREKAYLPYYLYRQKNMIGNLENIGFAKKDTWCGYNIVMIEENQPVIALGAGGISKWVAHAKINRLEQPKEIETYQEKIEDLNYHKGKWIQSWLKNRTLSLTSQ